MYDIDYALAKVDQEIKSSKYPSFLLEFAVTTLRSAQHRVAILERLWTACDALGVYVPLDGDPNTDLPWLEKLVSGGYRHEKQEVSKSIVSAIEEVREAEYEAEHDEAVAAIMAAGFEKDEENDNWRRESETVTVEIDIKGGYWWYVFEYNHPDGTRVSGKSGEFSKLLEAIRVPGAETSERVARRQE